MSQKYKNLPFITQRGFTIVELLVVIIIIAILAALTIITYSAMNTRATQSALRHGLSETTKRIELDKVTRGQYAALLADLNNSTSGSDDPITYQYSSTGSAFCLTGTLRGIAYNVSSGASTASEGVCSGHNAPVSGPITDPVVHTQAQGQSVTQMSGQTGVDIPITINYDLQPTDYVFVLFNSRENTRMSLRNGGTQITKIYDRSMGNDGYQWHQAFGISGISGQTTLTANACWRTSCPYTGANVGLSTSYIVYVIRGLGSSPTIASTFTPYGNRPGNGVTVAPAAQSISSGDVAIFSYVFYGSILPTESDASSPTLTWITDSTAPPSHLGTAIASRHAYATTETSVLYRNTMPASGPEYHGSVLFTFK